LEFDAQQRGFAHDPVGQAGDVAVGSFFGGGYDPGPDLPPPPPPAPVQAYDDVPVSVGTIPMHVSAFLGEPGRRCREYPQYGEEKVLLDGVTPV
jgi:hypothetical protein